MRSWIDHAGEVVWDPSPSLITQLVEAGQPFWLDIEDPTDEVIDQLATLLGLHPLAIEDSKQFGQRAKLQVYGNGAMVVGFGLDKQLREPVEVHCYYTTGFLITLRRAASIIVMSAPGGGRTAMSDQVEARHVSILKAVGADLKGNRTAAIDMTGPHRTLARLRERATPFRPLTGSDRRG